MSAHFDATQSSFISGAYVYSNVPCVISFWIRLPATLNTTYVPILSITKPAQIGSNSNYWFTGVWVHDTPARPLYFDWGYTGGYYSLEGGSLSASGWHHCLVHFTSVSNYIYVDGVRYGPRSSVDITLAAHLMIGAWEDLSLSGSAQVFGTLDLAELIIWRGGTDDIVPSSDPGLLSRSLSSGCPAMHIKPNNILYYNRLLGDHNTTFGSIVTDCKHNITFVDHPPVHVM